MSQKEYNNVSELITDLLTADRDSTTHEAYINIDNFSGAFYKGLEDKKDDFWKELLEYLKTNAPTKQSDFNDYEGKSSSVFSFINDNADLNGDTIWEKVIHGMTTNGIDLSTKSGVKDIDGVPSTGYFWNESLSKLIAAFVKDIGGESSKIYLKDDESAYILLDEIKNADAGYDFSEKWVLPNTNIDNQAYDEVRGSDAIQSVLKNSAELQFTRRQGENNWIRLLMPKYLRKVEVEDLNRNFWVIAQVSGAICAYLFGKNSIKDLLEGILKELVGLWENVLYLWGAAAMISQEDEPITDIHIEFVPIPNSKFLSYKKFDNFGNTYTQAATEIQNRMNYLIKQYSESNLVIIPEIRAQNYKHNYYSRVQYPGLIVYNRNTGTQTWCPFQVEQAWVMDGSHLIIDLNKDFNATAANQKYVNRIGAILENETTYSFVQNFSSITGTSPYYAAIRTVIPDFSAKYDTENNTIVINNFQFKFYDAAAQAIDGREYLVTSFSQNSASSDNEWVIGDTTQILTLYNRTEGENSGTLTTQTNITIERGFYLGELVSCQSILGLNQWTFNAQAYGGQQLYSATPEQIVGIMEAGQ